MVSGELTVVVLAGLLTALATGLGALPFFVGEVNDRLNVALWGFASGIMLAASLFGLVSEGLTAGGGFRETGLRNSSSDSSVACSSCSRYRSSDRQNPVSANRLVTLSRRLYHGND